MKRIFAAPILSTGLALLAAAPAAACSCFGGPDAPLPPVIVQAKVLSVAAGEMKTTAVLRVLKVERGRAGRQIRVETPASSAMCGVRFRAGETKRVGLARQGQGYSANLCQQIAVQRPAQ